MKKTRLLLLLAGFTLVACNTSTSSSVSDTSSNTSSEPAPQSKFDRFKEVFDALGNNYVSDDSYFYEYASTMAASSSMLIVEPHAMLNTANRSGIALARENNTVVGYRYAYDCFAQEGEKLFYSSYIPGNYYYTGTMYDAGVYSIDDLAYDAFFSMPKSSDITKLAQQLTSSTSITFDNSFVESVDSDTNYHIFTAEGAYAIAPIMYLLETNAFARMEGYANESYYYTVESFLEYAITSENINGVKLEITLIEDGGYPQLMVDIFANGWFESDEDNEYPFMERILVPLSLAGTYADELGLGDIVPDSFYESGPGEEPTETKAKRQELKEAITPLIEGNNYTLTHAGGILEELVYTASVVDNKTTAYFGSDFIYGYYFLGANSDFSNTDVAGIRAYQNSKGVEQDQAFYTYDYIKQLWTSQGLTVSDDFIATGTASDGSTTSIDIGQRLLDIYQSNFNSIGYQLGSEYDYFWENAYGSSWENQFFYNESTQTFIVTDYYLISALFGCDTVTTNYIDQLSFDLSINDGAISAQGLLYSYDTSGNTGYFDFGTISVTNVGTTKLPAEFATYLNTHYGTDYAVDAE